MKFLILILNYLYRKGWWYLNFWKYGNLGKKSFIYRPLKITRASIHCGNNVSIFKNSRIEGVSEWNDMKFCPKIIISNNVRIEQNLHLTCANEVFIGENTAIAANVTITDIHHPYTDVDLPIEKQNLEVKNVYIGKDSKIYNNAVILPGTIIGKHCTVGANSVVSGQFPDFCVIAGCPAKIIKMFNLKTRVWEKNQN